MTRRWFLAALGLAPFERCALRPLPPVPVMAEAPRFIEVGNAFAYTRGMEIMIPDGPAEFPGDGLSMASRERSGTMVITHVDYRKGIITVSNA